MVLLVDEVNKRLVALEAVEYVRVGRPVRRRHLIRNPLLGYHRWLGAHALQRLADVRHVVDYFPREIMRRADVVLLARPDVLELGAHDRLRVRISVPVLARSVDDAVMGTLEHVARVRVLDYADERIIIRSGRLGYDDCFFTGLVAQLAHINFIVVLVVVVALVRVAVQHAVFEMIGRVLAALTAR